MLMDVMGGVISGAAFGGEVCNHFEDYEAPQNVGHFVMAMKPDLFVSREEYTQRMDTLAQRVHANSTAEGFDEVIMPGEHERRQGDDVFCRVAQGDQLAAMRRDDLVIELA
jgi:LDH2 family malate/lactate/ureidoglycolate dehydrogenase